MEILTAAGTGTPKQAVDLATAATPPVKPQKDKLQQRSHRPTQDPATLTHHAASPLPKLIRTKALLDIPYGFHCYLQS